ncbi:MAG: hypothetical protein AAF546_03100 [Verrucomicrobiota bacterium]
MKKPPVLKWFKRISHHIKSAKTQSRRFIDAALLSALGLAFLPLGAQTVLDPTSLNKETAEAITALRRAAGTGVELDASKGEPDVRISGLVFSKHPSMGRGVVIVTVDKEHALAVEGQSLRLDDFDFTAERVDSDEVRLRNNRTGAIRVWRGDVLTKVDAADKVAYVEFNSVPLFLAAQALSYVTKDRIAVSRQARGTEVTLFLTSATSEEIIETLTLTHQLYPNTVGDSNIIRLQTIEEFARGSTNFQEERSQVFTLRFPNARDIALTIRDLYGERVRLSERIDEGEESGEFLTENLEQRLERFDIIADRSEGLGDSGDSGQSSGSTSQTSRLSSTRNNRTQNNSSLRNNQRSGGEDTEALTEDELLSLEFIDPALLEIARNAKADIFVSVIDRLNKLLVRTRDQRTMDEIATLVEELDQPVQLVFLEIRILRVELDDGLDTGLNWAFNDGRELTGQFSPANAVTGDLLFTYVGNDITADLNLLQSKGKLTVLGQPSLMTANNEVSRIFVGETVPVLTGFSESSTVVTDSGNTVNFVTPEYEEENVGTTILVTANINDDETVELRLLQEESQIVRNGANILGNVVGSGELTEISIDIVSSQSVSGTFVAANNRTFAVGGLITESIEDDLSQIPVLGDLPVVGRAFRNQGTNRSQSELILLIRPTLVTNPRDGAFTEKIANDYVKEQSMHPRRVFDSGNLDVFEDADVITPGEPEKDAPQETIDALIRERFGPIQETEGSAVEEPAAAQ